MDQKAMQQFRLDRRLIRRRGWIGREELARAVEALPDVSDKIAPREEEEAPEAPAGEQAGES
jgi:hypothetical protein